ncbi:MAG: hypothetical protein JSU08_10920 [Acidobacteria bacterium]|nr:hypothetical protein [Acidobacteriota bacterium]
MKRVIVGFGLGAGLLWGAPASAQNPPQGAPDAPHDHEHMHDMADMEHGATTDGGWHLMQDGAVYLLFNHQGGARGGDELRAPNWWMGMATRGAGRGTLTLSGMFSLDPATVGRRGYRELFQVGEAYEGAPNVDRQHPHDVWMQLAAAWRTPIGTSSGLTVAGAVAGEPALGPVAFMHRASAAAIPFAPLGHHTFDSTHVAFGVATVGLDRGPIAVEASAFNGREPDAQRWDFDFGRMDSFSGRLWVRPSPSVELQVSSGRLIEPEQLHHGNVVRSTASVSLTRGPQARMLAVSAGFGMNAAEEVTRRAAFLEATRFAGRTVLSARAEVVEVESMLLVLGRLPDHEDEARKDAVGAFTLGAQRDVATWKGMTAAVGVNGTLYRVPEILKATHGSHPASFQVFLQVRPPVGAMGRMWNMRMAGPPMAPGPHAGHVH